jgi:hypothetical protein
MVSHVDTYATSRALEDFFTEEPGFLLTKAQERVGSDFLVGEIVRLAFVAPSRGHSRGIVFDLGAVE